MPQYRDLLGLVRASQDHVAESNHVLGRFDDDPQRLKGYHCIDCGRIWMITVYDIEASAARNRNILDCVEAPEGFNILLEILNGDRETVSEKPADPPPRYDRNEPL